MKFRFERNLLLEIWAHIKHNLSICSLQMWAYSRASVSFFTCIYCVCVCVHLPGICVEVGRQPVGVGSLYSGLQAWWHVPFPPWAILLVLGFNFREAVRSWVVALKITAGKKASEGRTDGRTVQNQPHLKAGEVPWRHNTRCGAVVLFVFETRSLVSWTQAVFELTQ